MCGNARAYAVGCSSTTNSTMPADLRPAKHIHKENISTKPCSPNGLHNAMMLRAQAMPTVGGSGLVQLHLPSA